VEHIVQKKTRLKVIGSKKCGCLFLNIRISLMFWFFSALFKVSFLVEGCKFWREKLLAELLLK